MLTLEYILVLLALLASLGIILPLLEAHAEKTNQGAQHITDQGKGIVCSARAEHADARFLAISARGCLEYPYTLRATPDPLTLTLGWDANHYD